MTRPSSGGEAVLAVGEQRLEARERRVGPVETMRGIEGGNSGGLVDHRCRLPRLDPRIASRGVQARGERRTEPDEDAAHFALKPGIVWRKLPGREVRAEGGERVTGFERRAALDEPCGEQPLGAAGKSPAAFGRERGGIGPPLLVPVRARHRAEHVFRRLSRARALEDVRSLAGPPRPLEDHRQIEPYAGVGRCRLRERLELTR